MPSIIQRVLGLGLLLLLALVGSISMRMLNRMPNAIVYFVTTEADALQPARAVRRVKGGDLEERLINSITALQLGPLSSEQEEGYQNFVLPELNLYSLEHHGNYIEVNLSNDFYSTNADIQEARFLQLAYTLTQPLGIDQLILKVEGQPYYGADYPWQRPE